jgi:hypothetical protein
MTADGFTWELQLNEQQQADAERLNGERIVVDGRLERKVGTEIPERWIIHADSLRLLKRERQQPPGPPYIIKAGRADTKISISNDQEGPATIVVKSEFGIDRATIRRTRNRWPKQVDVRLHLRGLESLKVESGDTVVEWSLSSTGNHSLRVTVQQGEKLSEIAAGNPYFASLRINSLIGGGGNLIPLQDGYFSLTLPEKLFEGNPAEIRLSWVDFYRN